MINLKKSFLRYADSFLHPFNSPSALCAVQKLMELERIKCDSLKIIGTGEYLGANRNSIMFQHTMLNFLNFFC